MKKAALHDVRAPTSRKIKDLLLMANSNQTQMMNQTLTLLLRGFF
jgi:hypothetical protein